MSRAPIRAIFLDAGNTLFTERRPRAAIYATVARAHGGRVSEAEAAEWLGRIHAELPASLDGSFRYSLAWFRAFNERVLTACGVSAKRLPKAHDELVRRFGDPKTYKVFPEVEAALDELAARGLLVGIVSNWSERLPELCRALGLAARVRFVLSSAEMRSEKPDRAIFERALFRAGVPAEATLHVGDHFERDVRGALQAGLRAALVDRSGSGQEAVREGVPVLRDLRDLLTLLDAQPQSAAAEATVS
jgi:putative hydrolase of the HAD superfamily